MKTPLECLSALVNQGLASLKSGQSLAELQQQTMSMTDLQAAKHMQQAKAKLFALLNKKAGSKTPKDQAA